MPKPKPSRPAKTPKPPAPKSPPVRKSGWDEQRWEGTRIGEERSQHKKLPGGK